MRNPLKQGLKQPNGLTAVEKNIVAMRNPLKQGLKQEIMIRLRIPEIVAMRNPLKQGLKHMRTGRRAARAELSQCEIH